MKLKIDAKRTALLLLDVQKDLVDITPGLKENRIMENMDAVLKTSRTRKANVIHIIASGRTDFLDLPRDNPLHSADAMLRGGREGTDSAFRVTG